MARFQVLSRAFIGGQLREQGSIIELPDNTEAAHLRKIVEAPAKAEPKGKVETPAK